MMVSTLAFSLSQLRRMQFRLFVMGMACLLPVVARAQVTFDGAHPSVNFGSRAVGSPSATVSLPFTVRAGTIAGGIVVLITGVSGKDFAQATKSTCTAMTYSETTNCVVNVGFMPLFAGLRRGAVGFEVTPDGTQTMIGRGLISPAAVTVGAADDVDVTDLATDTVSELTPSGNQTTVSTRLSVPNGVSVPGSGSVYVADTFNQQATRINRADAPSLTFDPTKITSTSQDSPKTVEVEDIGNASLNSSALTYPPDFREGWGDNGRSSITSLARACALIIDFSPIMTFGSVSSRLLKEAVKLTTNDLSIPKKVQQVKVTGDELRD